MQLGLAYLMLPHAHAGLHSYLETLDYLQESRL